MFVLNKNTYIDKTSTRINQIICLLELNKQIHFKQDEIQLCSKILCYMKEFVCYRSEFCYILSLPMFVLLNYDIKLTYYITNLYFEEFGTFT